MSPEGDYATLARLKIVTEILPAACDVALRAPKMRPVVSAAHLAPSAACRVDVVATRGPSACDVPSHYGAG